MEFWSAISDIVLLLCGALLFGLAAMRLRQNALIGYLAAGVILGPAGLGVIRNVPEMRELAEIGVALLLFSIGLEFSFRRLRELGAVASAGGALQVALTAMFFFGAGSALGLPRSEAAIVGLALSVSSTAVVLRVLTDRAQLDSIYGRNSLGILLMQDIAVVPLALLISVIVEGGSSLEAMTSLGLSIGLGVLLVGAMFLASRYVLPPLLGWSTSMRERDLPVIVAVVVCMGATWGSHALELSPILGAFVAGILLAETPFAEQIRADVAPMRAIFVTVFFASVGMLGEMPSGADWPMILVLTAAILAVKALAVAGAVRVFRQTTMVSLATGLTLAQIGEFSFVLLQIALDGSAISERTYHALLTSSLLTLLVTPYLIAAAGRLCEMPSLDRMGLAEPVPVKSGRVIVVGFGPAGRKVVQLLREQSQPFLVLEMNSNTVTANRSDIPIAFGDAGQREILDHIHYPSARALVITVPDPQVAERIIGQAKSLAPQVPVIVRGRYNIFHDRLQKTGADHIIDEEEEVGARLAERLNSYPTPTP